MLILGNRGEVTTPYESLNGVFYKVNTPYLPYYYPSKEVGISIFAKSYKSFIDKINDITMLHNQSTYSSYKKIVLSRKRKNDNGLSLTKDSISYHRGVFKDLENNKYVGYISYVENNLSIVWDYDFILSNSSILKHDYKGKNYITVRTIVVPNLTIELEVRRIKTNRENFNNFIKHLNED